MSIPYSDVEKYIQEIKPQLQQALRTLDEIIIDGRDEKNVPIYLTKYRIKSIDSTYLKTKRKRKTSLEEITDFAGIRILCLFEKDIFDTHEFIINTLNEKNYNIAEFKIFNWTDKHKIDYFTNYARKAFPEIKINEDNKKSGYKSIHYVLEQEFNKKNYAIEIQLRTLLQDVWGELEHSLSYKKGDIHPHIRKSFELLARDLETNDILMSNLREISDKELCGAKYTNEKSGPTNYFSYEEKLLPPFFKVDPVKSLYEKYWGIIKKANPRERKKEWIVEALKSYDAILKKISAAEAKNPEVAYWTDMERAFLHFCAGEYDQSLAIYRQLREKYNNRYCIYFRIGEIEILNGNIERALAAFDESERLISAECEIDYYNKYRIKLILALTYWMLGPEYIDIAIEEIIEAQYIVESNKDMFSDKDVRNLTNNICWYYLVKYITTKSNDDFIKATEKYAALKKIINNDSTSNMLDTASWYCYHAYLKTKEKSYLEQAKSYCMEMRDRVNYTTYNFMSMNIHINHIQEILNQK